MIDYPLPWYTNAWWAIVVFFVSLLVFHISLVWIGKLTSIGWKKVDYFWVSLALLGVIATVGQTRSLVARNLVSNAEVRLAATLSWVKSSGEFGTSPAVCREFVRSQFSPPEPEFREMQRQFTAQCEWFRALVPKLHALETEKTLKIDLATLLGARPPGGEPYAYSHLDDSVRDFNQSRDELDLLRAEAEISGIEELILVLGPFLVAVAIALRLTKVTGEIGLERSRAEA